MTKKKKTQPDETLVLEPETKAKKPRKKKPEPEPEAPELSAEERAQGDGELLLTALRLELKLYEALRPPENLTVSEWADRYRILSPETSASPGRWRTSRVPYSRAIMDAFNIPGVKEVILKAAAQVAKTEILLNVVGYSMHYKPRPILALLPTLDMAETFSKDRIAIMARDTPVLSEVMADPKSKEASNTIYYKQFKGGYIVFAGANSPASLSSRPIPIVIADEVSRYAKSAGKEGSPLNLAKKRSTTFWDKKLFACSTPTEKGLCTISSLFDAPDVRRHQFFIPCPHCQKMILLKWERVNWQDANPETAVYLCQECEGEISDHQKIRSLQKGEWIAENPEIKEMKLGFHLTGLCSPWVTFKEMVAEYLAAKQTHDEERMRVFVNTYLGEAYDPLESAVDQSELFRRREHYRAELPAGVIIVTCGIDVQLDSLHAHVMGFGKGNEKWSIDYRIIHGSPEDPKTWAALDQFLAKEYVHEWGFKLPIHAAGIDSGGLHTQIVYSYVKARRGKRIFALKGVSGTGKPVAGQPSRRQTGRDKRRVDLFPVGVDEAKTMVYQWFTQDQPGFGYFHFPTKSVYDEAFFASLTSEQVRIIYKGGHPVKQWTLPHGRRNEVLDTTVYAFAALHILNPELDIIEGQHERLREDLQTAEEDRLAPLKSKKRTRSPSLSSFAYSWKMNR